MLLVMIFHVSLNSDDVHHSRVNYVKSREILLEEPAVDSGKVSHIAHTTSENTSGKSDNSIKYVLNENNLHKLGSHSNWTSDQIKPCIGKPARESFQFVEISPQFLVYSVFWDTRSNDFDNIDGGVYLRIMTVISQGIAKQKKGLYCLFEDPERKNVQVQGSPHDGDTDVNTGYISVLATYYEMCENHGKSQGGYILSCRVPEELYNPQNKTPLCSVRLSPSHSHNEGADFHIVDTKPRPDAHGFSVCTAPLYGDIPKTKLVEFIELSAMLGAEHITFYDFDISQVTQKLLRYYQKQSRVTLIPWPLPKNIDAGVWYHGQLIAILDCLYRNMATSKYLAFNDIDEFMVPYNYTDWKDMMTHLDKEGHCGYQFNSAFFDPSKGDSLQDPKTSKLVTFTSNKKTSSSSRIRTKCMVKPYQLFEAGIHHISKPILAHLQIIRLDLPDALLHHYRTCQANFRMNCHLFENNTIIPERYGKVLVDNVYRNLDRFDQYINAGVN